MSSYMKRLARALKTKMADELMLMRAKVCKGLLLGFYLNTSFALTVFMSLSKISFLSDRRISQGYVHLQGVCFVRTMH